MSNSLEKLQQRARRVLDSSSSSNTTFQSNTQNMYHNNDNPFSQKYYKNCDKENIYYDQNRQTAKKVLAPQKMKKKVKSQRTLSKKKPKCNYVYYEKQNIKKKSVSPPKIIKIQFSKGGTHTFQKKGNSRSVKSLSKTKTSPAIKENLSRQSSIHNTQNDINYLENNNKKNIRDYYQQNRQTPIPSFKDKENDEFSNKNVSFKVNTKNDNSINSIKSNKKFIKDKNNLKQRISVLEEKILQQNDQIKTIRQKSKTRSVSRKSRSNSTISNKQSLQEQIAILKENEVRLMEELNDQQKITREALQKLYNYQEEILLEKETFRESQHQAQLKSQEQELIISDLQNKIIDQNKQLDLQNQNFKIQQQDTERRYEQMMQEQYQQQQQQIQQIFLQQKRQQEQYQNHIFEQTQSDPRQNQQLNPQYQCDKCLQYIQELCEYKHQTGIHKSQIEMLSKNITNYKEQKEKEEQEIIERTQREMQFEFDKEKHVLNQQIEDLQKQLQNSQNEMNQKELNYAQKLEDIQNKIQVFQDQVLGTERENQELIQQIDKYKQKIKEQKKVKNQWKSVYNDMFSQINSLKQEIDFISGENKSIIEKFTVY